MGKERVDNSTHILLEGGSSTSVISPLILEGILDHLRYSE